MAEGSIPVDLFNPGQVFACLGLMEAAEVLVGDAEGAFDWRDANDVRFRLRASGDRSPIEAVLAFIDRASASSEAPQGSPSIAAWKSTWGDDPLAIERGDGYPFPDPPSPATLVCVLGDGQHRLRLDHWGDATKRDNVKFWAGAGGYPGVALARDALQLIDGRALPSLADPFALSAVQSSSFRLDWRRDYIPLDAGFSPNKHSTILTVGFPLVELLAALGLSHARPKRVNKLDYRYGVAGWSRGASIPWLPPTLLRAALGTSLTPFAQRRFRMLLDWPGKEDQLRTITTVTEESSL